MAWVLVGIAALLGLAVGSFGNVVIYRVPRRESVVSPPSACPRCGTGIAPQHNVPVLSWLWLRGRCATCREPISVRYPSVEASVGALFGLIVWQFGISWETLLLLVGAWAAVVLAAIDIDVQRLPRVIVGPWAAFTVAVIVISVVSQQEWWVGARSVIGAVALGLFYFVAFIAYPRGMGWGDVTVAPVLGLVLAYFGWSELIVGAFMAFVWGIVAAIVPMIRARSVVGVKIPFGPWMFLGAATGIVLGNLIGDWYMERILGF
jgi:leader peptidase (prepilin peptidase)/N-methyltransferase